MADGRRRAMAGINDNVVRQRVKLCSNTISKHVKTAAGEVVPADAFAKENITADDDVRIANQEYDMPR